MSECLTSFGEWGDVVLDWFCVVPAACFGRVVVVDNTKWAYAVMVQDGGAYSAPGCCCTASAGGI